MCDVVCYTLAGYELPIVGGGVERSGAVHSEAECSVRTYYALYTVIGVNYVGGKKVLAIENTD